MALTLLRQNAPWLATGMNGEESPPKLERRGANGYGEFRHPYQDAPRLAAGRLHCSIRAKKSADHALQEECQTRKGILNPRATSL